MADVKIFYLSFTLIFMANWLFGIFDISEGFSPMPDLEAIIEQKANPEKFLFRNECYPDIGCFYNGPPFYHVVNRPISVQPRECENMTFPLFTPRNPKRSYNLTLKKSSIRRSPHRCDLSTIFISHGFLADNKAFRKMKSKILSVGDYNVIVPNYPDYALPPYYQAVANVRAIGARVAVLIQLLMDYCNNQDASKFHLIGHSIGAHMSGYAAKHLGKKVGRISGLDVAGPYFQGCDEETRLTTDDADFVDVIHTNAAKTVLELGFGYYNTVGNIDFWINNGYTQPGCDIPQNVVRDKGINFTHIFVLTVCSHTRATEVYTESIVSKDCVFKGVRCDSYDDFIAKKCSGDKAELGFHIQKKDDIPPNSTFYLETNANKPYCKKDQTTADRSWNPLVNMYNRYFG